MNQGKSFEEIHAEMGKETISKKDLATMLFGAFYREAKENEDNIVELGKTWEKYNKFAEEFAEISQNSQAFLDQISERIYAKNMHAIRFMGKDLPQDFKKRISKQSDGTRELNEKVRTRESVQKKALAEGKIAQEYNGIDQIVKAKTLIKKACLEKDTKLAEVVDPRLLNILNHWANAEPQNIQKLQGEDLTHLAHLLSQKVRP